MKIVRIGILALIVIAVLCTVLLLPRRQAAAESGKKTRPTGASIAIGAIGQHQNFSSALTANGLPDETAYQLLKELGRWFDLRKCQPADSFRIEYDSTRTLQRFTYLPQNDIKTYALKPTPGGGYFTEITAPELSTHLAACHGKIGNSLFGSMSDLGLKPKLIMDFAGIFQWDIDFLTEPQKGDEFNLVYEEIRAGGRFVRYGNILVARYHSRTYDKTAYRFPEADGTVHYYDAAGESFQKAFLKSPLNYTRISSSFGYRRHPISKQVRMHSGIDFAAPKGTPVEAASDGVVTHRGWLGGHPGGKGGYGNTVKIRHANGYETLYGHLSGFAAGLKVGDHVSQHEVIGYVGSTGMSTGNHLHYTIYHNKQPINPLDLQNLSGPPLAASDRQRFGWDKERLDILLNLFANKGLSPETGDIR
jgi:murein DD-endopeptidase MepM/ murein hydrolase activator NlpD